MLECDDLQPGRYASNDRLRPCTTRDGNETRPGTRSTVDDFIETGYCKRESKLVLRSAEIKPTFSRSLFLSEITHHDGSDGDTPVTRRHGARVRRRRRPPYIFTP